jgi:CubicO group peptidase (beta-lactamase class C family)
MRVLDQFNEKDSSFTTVPAKREITIRDLFTHTGGIACSEEVSAIKMKNKLTTELRTLGEFTKEVVELPIAYQPGEKWVYSGCMNVLAYVCEIISGQSFDQFLQTRLFGPLGMSDTYFYVPAGKASRLPAIYSEDAQGKLQRLPKSEEEKAKDPNGTYFWASGGLNSTLTDYAIFQQMLLNGGEYNGKRILSPATVRMALSNQIGDLNTFFDASGKILGDIEQRDKYGLGFGLTSATSAAILPVSEGSFYWGGFWGTWGWVDPNEGIVAMIFTQKAAVPNTTASDLWGKFQVLVYQAIMQLNYPKRLK